MELPLMAYTQVCEKLGFESQTKVEMRPFSSNSNIMEKIFGDKTIGLGSVAILLAVLFSLVSMSIKDHHVDCYSASLWVAKMCAVFIIAGCMCILWFVSYHFISFWSRCSPYVGHYLTHNVQTHMYLGYTILFFSICHAIAWEFSFY